MNKIFIGTACILLLSACDEDPATIEVPPRVQPQSQAEIAFVHQTLNAIQPASIQSNREFCGYIGIDRNGNFIATTAQQGRRGFCTSRWPGNDLDLLASYHSHGAYSEGFDSEVPSYDDMRVDITEGVDGYIATPGGRVWYVDADAKLARQLCGPGCITQDPFFRDDTALPVQTVYDLDSIADRENY